MWKVVSGEEQGGILVRGGCELASPLMEQRLSFGSWVLQKDLVEGPISTRLHYKLVEGKGPETGWVTIQLNHKKLLIRDAFIREISESRWLGLLYTFKPSVQNRTQELPQDSLFARAGCGCGQRLCNFSGIARLTNEPIAVQNYPEPPACFHCMSGSKSCTEVQLSPRKRTQIVQLSPTRDGVEVMGLDDEDEFVEDNAIELEYAALDAPDESIHHSIEAEYEALSVDNASKKRDLVHTIDLLYPNPNKPMLSWSRDTPQWMELLHSKYRESPIRERVEKFAHAAGISENSADIPPTILEFSPEKSPRKARKSFGGA